MSTADRLLPALRALLAEFRSPENCYWLTSACADRLEAVLTEHAREEVMPDGERQRSQPADIREPDKSGEGGAFVTTPLWGWKDRGRLRAFVARYTKAADDAAETGREAESEGLLVTAAGQFERAATLREVVAELDALLSAPVVSTPQEDGPFPLSNPSLSWEEAIQREREAAASRGGGDPRPPRQDEKQP